MTGSTAIFSVTSSGSSPTFQWKKNGVAIAGATSSTYSTPAAIWSDDGAKYTVAVTTAGGSVTSNPATEHLALTSDQQTYEGFALGTGTYEGIWNLNYTTAQSAASNYLLYDYATLTLSPLTNGPQTVAQQAPVNLTQSLPIPAGSPTRILKGGAILVVPGYQNWSKVTYVAGGIQVDELASDNATVAYTYLRYGYTVVPLSGLLHAAPTELTQPYNSVFSNSNVLDTTTTWAAGAAYDRFSEKNVGDRYDVFDCFASTTGATPSPCNSGTTLAAAMAAGEQSVSDAFTYHTGDGTISTIGGVPVWVATNQRPQASVGATTTEYRIYFELNGNVYTGALIKDGAQVGGSHYRTNPGDASSTQYLDYLVRLNSAAIQSLAAGSLL